MESKNLNEEELLKKIEEGTDELEIPESLKPENMVKMLKASQTAGQNQTTNRNQTTDQSQTDTLIPKDRFAKRRGITGLGKRVVAAGLILVLFATGYGVSEKAKIPVDRYTPDVSKENTIANEKNLVKTAKLGESFHLAANYEEIDKAIPDYRRGYLNKGNDIETAINGFFHGGITGDKGVVEESATADDAATNSGAGEFSETNIMTEGVDESDYVRTDGSYLYYLYDNELKIYDVAKNYEVVAQITAPSSYKLESGDTINFGFQEFFLDGDRLYLVGQATTFGEMNFIEEAIGTTEVGEIMSCCCFYNPAKKAETMLYTFDLTDRTNPTLIGTLSQDGYLNTARKVGDYVYLFSDFYIDLQDENYTYKDFVPFVNGEPLKEDSIYLGKEAYMELVMSSIDVKNPELVYDTLAVCASYPNVYVGSDSIYLYEYEWREEAESEDSLFDEGTTITKFSYQDGVLNGVANAYVNGTLYDSFAINEYNDCLRLILSGGKWDEKTETYNRSNMVCVLDANLNEIGRVTGIADGESVYSARFMGDKGYFVTYLNHDPVFVVDLSDPTNPTLLGNVEISGYSDYLHMYGDGMLLGLGYETDEETSQTMGIKVSMFDFSDPLHPYTIASYVEKADYCWADFDNYKDLLVDPKKNLIGFSAFMEDYEAKEERVEYRVKYFLYSWDGSKFVNEATIQCPDEFYEESKSEDGSVYRDFWGTLRGLYIGNDFLLVSNGQIKVYDMANEFSCK